MGHTLRRIQTITPFLEAKASKGMHQVCQVCNEKSPDHHTSVLKIVPLVVHIRVQVFVKCFDIAVFVHFESVRSIVNQRNNINNIFTVLNVYKALNVRFWQVSPSFDLFLVLQNVMLHRQQWTYALDCFNFDLFYRS